jgi:hypothetical protein
MAYLGLSPEPPQVPALGDPEQYFSEISSPGDADNCARYCAWLASKKAGSFTMDYMERPPGCTCPGEIKGTEYTTELPMTPQQIEAAVKQIQPAQGSGLALAAIAAYLILGA